LASKMVSRPAIRFHWNWIVKNYCASCANNRLRSARSQGSLGECNIGMVELPPSTGHVVLHRMLNPSILCQKYSNAVCHSCHAIDTIVQLCVLNQVVLAYKTPVCSLGLESQYPISECSPPLPLTRDFPLFALLRLAESGRRSNRKESKRHSLPPHNDNSSESPYPKQAPSSALLLSPSLTCRLNAQSNLSRNP
jgi:hypothetical protein